MKISVKMTGLEEMIQKLKIFEEQLDLEITRQATRDASQVILEAMQSRAPVRIDEKTPGSRSMEPGELKASLRFRVKRKRYGVFFATIGPDKRHRGLANSVEYGHRLVKGGKSRVKKSGMVAGTGRVVGHVPAHPFLRPAIDETAQAAIDAYGKTMWALSKEILTRG